MIRKIVQTVCFGAALTITAHAADLQKLYLSAANAPAGILNSEN